MEAPETKEVLDTTPSAPMATDEPSAPPSAPIDTFQSNECVICLENKVKGNYYYYFCTRGRGYNFSIWMQFTFVHFSATSFFCLVVTFVVVGIAKMASLNALYVEQTSPRKYGSIERSLGHFGWPRHPFKEWNLKFSGWYSR